jgi:predicted PolB exonuclease-like 3'-5' exonuclease
MKTMILDIETIPDQNLPEELKPVFDKGRLVDPDKIAKAEQDFNDDMIKKLSVNPMTCQIVSLQFKTSIESGFVQDAKFPVIVNDETAMLEQFWNEAMTTKLFVGHNILGFDLPVIMIRSMVLGIKPSIKIPMAKYRAQPVYDTMQILGGWSKYISLDDALIRLGLPVKTGHGSDVYQMWVDGQFAIDDKQYEVEFSCMSKAAIYDMEISRSKNGYVRNIDRWVSDRLRDRIAEGVFRTVYG